IQATRLQEAMEAAYRAVLPRGRHPYAVIALQCDPADVDANVHPAKAEVLLHQERETAAALAAVVRSALASVPDQPAASAWALVSHQPSLGFAGVVRSGQGNWGQVREQQQRYDAPRERVEKARRVIAALPHM